MKKLLLTTTLLTASLGAHAASYSDYDDPCQFWYDSAHQVFEHRQNDVPMPEQMANWGNRHELAAYIVEQAYHPLYGFPGFSEQGKKDAALSFANRIAERCYRENW